jgi:hypothetical protein
MELESVANQISNDLIYSIQVDRSSFGKYIVSGIPEDYTSYISDYLPKTPKQDIKKIAYLVKENVEDYINNILSVGAKPIRYGQTIQDIYNIAMQLRGLNPASSDDLFTEVGERLGITLDENIRPLIIAIYNWQPGQDMTDVTNAMQQMGGTLPGEMDLSGSTPELGTIPAMEGYTYGPGGGGPGIVANKSIPIKLIDKIKTAVKKVFGKSIPIKLAQDDDDDDEDNGDDEGSDTHIDRVVEDYEKKTDEELGRIDPGFKEHEVDVIEEDTEAYYDRLVEEQEKQENKQTEEEFEAEQGDYEKETQEPNLVPPGDAPDTEDMEEDVKSALGLTRNDLFKDNLLSAVTAREEITYYEDDKGVLKQKIDYKGSKELAAKVALYDKAWNIGDSIKTEGIIDIALGYGNEKKAKELLVKNFEMSSDQADKVIKVVNSNLKDKENAKKLLTENFKMSDDQADKVIKSVNKDLTANNKAKELLAENFGMSYDKAENLIDVINEDLGDWKNNMIDSIIKSYNKSFEEHKKPGKTLKKLFTREDFYTEEDINNVLIEQGKKLADQGKSKDEILKETNRIRKDMQNQNVSGINLATDLLEGALIQRSKMLLPKKQLTDEAADLFKNVIDGSSDVVYSTESPQWFKSINKIIASMPLQVTNDVVDLMGQDKFAGLEQTIYEQTADNRKDIEAKEEVWRNTAPDEKKKAAISLGVAEGKLRDKSTKIYEDFYHDMLLTIAGIPGAEEVHKNIAGWIDYFRPTRPLKTRMLGGEETNTVEHFRESWLPAYDMIRGWAEYGNNKSNAISRLPTSEDPTKDLRGIEKTIIEHQRDNPDVPIQTDRISKYLVVNISEIGEDGVERVRTIKTINPLFTKYVSKTYTPKAPPDPKQFYSVIDEFQKAMNQAPVEWKGKWETEVDISVDELTTGEKYPAEVIKRSPILENYKTELDNIKNQLEPIYTDLRYDYSNPQAGPAGRPSPEEYYESAIGKIVELQKELSNFWQETNTEEIAKHPGLQKQLKQQYDDLSNSTSDLLDKVRDLSAKNKEFREPTELGKPTLESFNRVVTNLGDYVYSLSYVDALAPGRLTKEDVTALLKDIETNMSTFREQINNAKNQLKESLSEKDLSTLKKQFSEAKILYNTLGDARSQVKELLSTEPKLTKPKEIDRIETGYSNSLINRIVDVLEHKPEFNEWRKENIKYEGDINQKALSDILQDEVLRESVADALGMKNKGGEAELKRLLSPTESLKPVTEAKPVTEPKPGDFVWTDSGEGIITSILVDKFSVINLEGKSSWVDISNLEDSVTSPDALSKANARKLNNMYQAWLRHTGKKANKSIPIKSVGSSIPLNFNTQVSTYQPYV